MCNTWCRAMCLETHPTRLPISQRILKDSCSLASCLMENLWSVLACSSGDWAKHNQWTSYPQHNTMIKIGALLFPQNCELIYTSRHQAAIQGHPWLHGKFKASSLKECTLPPPPEKRRGGPNKTPATPTSGTLRPQIMKQEIMRSWTWDNLTTTIF